MVQERVAIQFFFWLRYGAGNAPSCFKSWLETVKAQRQESGRKHPCAELGGPLRLGVQILYPFQPKNGQIGQFSDIMQILRFLTGVTKLEQHHPDNIGEGPTDDRVPAVRWFTPPDL